MENHYVYDSTFIVKNQKYLLLEIEQAVNEYTKNNYKDTKNITWDYKNYNIFNITANYTFMPKLKKILLSYIRVFFNEHDVDYGTGIVMQSWINYHETKNDVASLKLHTHHWHFQGYICIDPLNSSTVFCEINGKPVHEILNRTGLIYISNTQYPHYVRLNCETLDKPRVTIGFDINIVKNQDKTLSTLPNVSTELIFL